MSSKEFLSIPAVRGLVVLLAIIAMFSLIRWQVKKIAERSKAHKTRETSHVPDPANFRQIPSYYRNFAKRIGDSMKGFLHLAGGPRDKAFQEAVEMNDDELAEVSNQYAKMFPNTLLTDIEGEIGAYYTDLDNKLEARLRALGAT